MCMHLTTLAHEPNFDYRLLLPFREQIVGVWAGISTCLNPLMKRGQPDLGARRRELAAWEQLCMTLRISDAWSHEGFARVAGSLSFSSSDRWLGGTNLSRLDRFYISGNFGDRGGTVGILTGTTFSDQAPVVLVLEDQRRPTRTQLRIPEVVLIDACLCGEIEEIWMEAHRQELDPTEQCAM